MSAPVRDWRPWARKAEEDRQAIALLLAGPNIPWSIVCFHAQQAAEKYLKAYLISVGVDPERTHSLDRLLAECLPHDSTLVAFKEECQALTDYAVDIRYPDMPVADEERLAREAVAMTNTICSAVDKRLSKP